MSKILIYDDEPTIVAQLKSGIRNLNAGLKPVVFTELKSLRDYIYSDDNWDDVKGLVFDLAQKKEEGAGITDFEILEDIRWCYENRRVPILIHSAYAEELEVLKTYPSVLLFKKGARSIREVRDCIGLLENSGFLDLFCEGPLLKDEVRNANTGLGWGDDVIKRHFHSSFIQTFKGANLLDDLGDILNRNKNPKRETYQKYLHPAVQVLNDL